MDSVWDELGPGVFRRHYPFLRQNIGVVIGSAGVLVIDTRATSHQADEVREDLARLTSRTVGWVVNTHYHWDHTFGNSRFVSAAIWGHVACRRHLRIEGEGRKAELIAQGRYPELADLGAVEIVVPDHVMARGPVPTRQM